MLAVELLNFYIDNVAIITWLAEQPQSEVDVVLLVRLSVRPVRVHVDHRLAAHVEQETCNNTTTKNRKYFLKMGNIFYKERRRWVVIFVAAACNVMMMTSLNT